MRMRGHPSRKLGRARSSHLRLSWRREHGRGTAGSSSMSGFTAPGAALLGTARSWSGILPFTHLAREGRMTVTIGRRELLAALGGAAAWPPAARAQQPGGAGETEAADLPAGRRGSLSGDSGGLDSVSPSFDVAPQQFCQVFGAPVLWRRHARSEVLHSL